NNQLARVHAIWGISQLARRAAQHAALLVPLLQDADSEIRAQAAKWLGDIRYGDAGSALIPLLAEQQSRPSFFAAEALGRIQYGPAVPPILAMLKANNDEDAYLRHAGTLALARIGNAAPLLALADNPSRALRIAAVVALRRMNDPDIARFLNDDDEFIVTETARAINDDLSIEGALPALADLLNTTSFSNEALVRRIINANLRVGNEHNLQQLMQYAQNGSHPAPMRAEALAALSTWARPSVVDRVDGRYRGVIERDAEALKNQTATAYIDLLTDREPIVRLSAAQAIHKLGIQQAAPALLAGLKDDKETAMRVECLSALVTLEAPQQEEAIKFALADREKTLRVAALDLLENMAISKPVMVGLLADVINTKTIEEKQAAIIALAKVPMEHSGALLNKLLDEMEAGQLNPEVYLELGEAIDSTRAEPLAARYKTITQHFSADQLMASYASSLQGGDVQRGRRVFFQHQQAQCMRCHALDDRGGNAGPQLNGVANRLTREELL